MNPILLNNEILKFKDLVQGHIVRLENDSTSLLKGWYCHLVIQNIICEEISILELVPIYFKRTNIPEKNEKVYEYMVRLDGYSDDDDGDISMNCFIDLHRENKITIENYITHSIQVVGTLFYKEFDRFKLIAQIYTLNNI